MCNTYEPPQQPTLNKSIEERVELLEKLISDYFKNKIDDSKILELALKHSDIFEQNKEN